MPFHTSHQVWDSNQLSYVEVYGGSITLKYIFVTDATCYQSFINTSRVFGLRGYFDFCVILSMKHEKSTNDSFDSYKLACIFVVIDSWNIFTYFHHLTIMLLDFKKVCDVKWRRKILLISWASWSRTVSTPTEERTVIYGVIYDTL